MNLLNKPISYYNDEDTFEAQRCMFLIQYVQDIPVEIEWDGLNTELTVRNPFTFSIYFKTNIVPFPIPAKCTLNMLVDQLDQLNLRIPRWLLFKSTPNMLSFIEKIKTTQVRLYVEDCCVCRELTTSTTICGHNLCVHCIYELYKRNYELCPLCKQSLKKEGVHNLVD